MKAKYNVFTKCNNIVIKQNFRIILLSFFFFEKVVFNNLWIFLVMGRLSSESFVRPGTPEVEISPISDWKKLINAPNRASKDAIGQREKI